MVLFFYEPLIHLVKVGLNACVAWIIKIKPVCVILIFSIHIQIKWEEKR